MKIYDIFCDASVTNHMRGACAGALATERYSQNSRLYAVIQPNGTNNSGEICGILQGVLVAIEIKRQSPEPCRFNIFSDSIISIRGVREWMFHWIYNANANRNNMLMSYSGTPVANQLYFKIIFNNIILNNIELYFYHQKGHVEGKYQSVANLFEKNNGISLMRLGLTPEYISTFNNYVDGRTRDILRQYFDQGHISMSGVTFDPIANTKYEDIAKNMPIPVIQVDGDQPTDAESANFAMLNGKNIIAKYAELIHAFEYPSANRIRKYIS